MTKRAIFPAGSAETARQIRISPAILSRGHVFLTGMTGSGPDGSMPEDPAVQIRAAFDKIAGVLKEAGLGCDSIVEMTSYHVDINSHFDLFNDIRAGYVSEPFPAWTAVGVAELRRPGAIVEIKVIAEAAI
jgi:enamine deaminase RidA (YjgF/YER057c/UK114 family)